MNTCDVVMETFMKIAEQHAERVPLEIKEEIDALDHEALARRWRFDERGDPFWKGDRGAYAMVRFFKHFGGMTPELSKKLGHGETA